MPVSGHGVHFQWNDKSMVQAIRGWNRRWHGTIPTLRIIGQYVAEIGKQAFDKEANPETGEQWAPLNPVYAAWKAKNRWSRKALVKTRQLKGSISYSVQRPHVFIGPSAHHGVHHQYGAPKASIPARPFMGLSVAHEEQVKKIVSDWISGRRL